MRPSKNPTKACKACDTTFPTCVKVDGKFYYYHKRMYCFQCEPPRSQRCRFNPECHNFLECTHCKLTKPVIDFYANSKGFPLSLCKDCHGQSCRLRKRKFKQECVKYKGGCCQRCGYSKCIWAMEFHHRNPAEKKFKIADSPHHSLSETIKKELDKCDLLCVNCHREAEYEDADDYSIKP